MSFDFYWSGIWIIKLKMNMFKIVSKVVSYTRDFVSSSYIANSISDDEEDDQASAKYVFEAC